jgi:hypothetical protein
LAIYGEPIHAKLGVRYIDMYEKSICPQLSIPIVKQPTIHRIHAAICWSPKSFEADQ